MSQIGELVRAWREAPERQWSVAYMAKLVGTSRQNIENLEAGKIALPKYICELADVMGTTTDSLLGRRALTAEEPQKIYAAASNPNRVLDGVAAMVASTAPEARGALAEAVAGFIRDSASPVYRSMVLAVVGVPAGRKR